MKRLFLIGFIVIFCSNLLFCQIDKSDKLYINSIHISQIGLRYYKSHRNIYSLRLSIKNTSCQPVFFWSWYNGWFHNLILSTSDICFIRNYVSDHPVQCLILPGMCFNYHGDFYFENDLTNRSNKDLFIAFKVYDALKISFSDFIGKDQIVYKSKIKNEFIGLHVDTIRKLKFNDFYLFRTD